MSVKNDNGLHNLVHGQLWKLANGFIQIGQHGKLLVEYKRLEKPQQRRVPSSLIRPAELVDYLRKNNAQLLN